jgi:formate--tetrahydrofolate ligase
VSAPKRARLDSKETVIGNEQTASLSLRPIAEVAADIGLGPDDLELYGRYKAKIRLDREKPAGRPGKYVVVTSVTPTPAGEGKTTVAIGLAQSCWRLGVKSIVALRQASLGPSFGIKGGGTGGGRSTLEPASDLNLHLTGDSHAVAASHNACSAFLDNSLHHGNPFDIDPNRDTWPRVIDMNDRALRKITIGQGEKNGPERATRFEITAASEVMSILSLATSYQDLRERMGRIVVGFDRSGRPVSAEDLKIAGAMAGLVRDALSPNLAQTREGTPALVHSGPFGNVALGNSSIIADRMGLPLADLLITEAGFGTELGLEKFCNVKCRTSGLRPDVAVVVVTIRSLKAHCGRFKIRPGKPPDPALEKEDLEALESGLPNLAKHLENVCAFGIPAVVAINAHPADACREVDRVLEAAKSAGAVDAVVTSAFADGGAGAESLARSVLQAAEMPNAFHFLYALDQPLMRKVEQIAKAMYGAAAVDFDRSAMEELVRLEMVGFGGLPICMAKTQFSLSDNSNLKGRPEGFRLSVRDLLLYAGAGYVVPIAGDIMLMPGLGKHPSGEQIDLLPDGTIVGLS